MAYKSLKETNPHLRNSKLYNAMLMVNVTSSATVELGKLNPALLKALTSKIPTNLIVKIGEQGSSLKF